MQVSNYLYVVYVKNNYGSKGKLPGGEELLITLQPQKRQLPSRSRKRRGSATDFVRSPELLAAAAAGTSDEFHAPALSVPLGPYRSLERMHPSDDSRVLLCVSWSWPVHRWAWPRPINHPSFLPSFLSILKINVSTKFLV